jgi:hypothetical protein
MEATGRPLARLRLAATLVATLLLGVVRHEGTGAQLLADPEVARLYLGVAAAGGLRRGPRGRTDAGPGAS